MNDPSPSNVSCHGICLTVLRYKVLQRYIMYDLSRYCGPGKTMALTLSYRAVGLKQVDLLSSRLGDYWSGDCLITVKWLSPTVQYWIQSINRWSVTFYIIAKITLQRWWAKLSFLTYSYRPGIAIGPAGRRYCFWSLSLEELKTYITFISCSSSTRVKQYCFSVKMALLKGTVAWDFYSYFLAWMDFI